MDATVMPSAEMAYIRHQRDRGVKTLIAWFRAELSLRDEATRACLEPLSDARLKECQNGTEDFAQRWRETRLAAQEAAIA